eukprot:2667964-Amphidinium_carterae.1
MWQQAVHQDAELGQLSLDTSKCFDTLSHSTLLRLSAQMGLPLVVRRPFEDFVTRHRRGDSLSVLFAVIWGIAMHGVIRCALPQPELTLAIYLDDVTFMSADPSLLLRALAASEAFMLSWNIQLN